MITLFLDRCVRARVFARQLAQSFAFALLCGSASGMSVQFSYDGSYQPDDPNPPAGQDTWEVVKTGDPSPSIIISGGSALVNDSTTSGRLSFSRSLEQSSSGLQITDPSLLTWEYTVRASVLSPGFPRAIFGVRDEGEAGGKLIMFAHASTGGNLFYVVSNSVGVLGEDIYTEGVDGPNLADDLFHEYRIVKYDNSGSLAVDFFVDGVLHDTRPYSVFNNAISTNLGVGVFTSTPGTSDYVIDQVSFSAMLSEPQSVPGDYNGDGIVDAADYTVWRDTLGSTEMLDADGDQSGEVDSNDYTFWRERYGDSLNSPASTSLAVPEANALVLLQAALVTLTARGRRGCPSISRRTTGAATSLLPDRSPQ